MNRYHGFVVWLFYIYMQTTIGFYHEPSRKLIVPTNLKNDSYFGYSISYQRNLIRLIVGAPKADIIGQVYSIDIDSNNKTLLKTPQILLDNVSKINSTNDTLHNFLLGATVKGGTNFFVTCAPNNAEILEGFKVVFGLCFENTIHDTIRVTDNDTVTKARALKPYGWSVELLKSNEILIGAPPVYEGLVKLSKNHTFRVLEQLSAQFLFGYGLAAGNYFDGDDISSIFYAVSTPVGVTGNGKVLFFDADNLNQIDKYTINDYNLGSLFGASLCTINLNDHVNYLLVGAPTYTEDNIIDRGVVHLYMLKNSEFILHKTIEAPLDSSSYFGYSLANLGDMDNDFKDEVAIGAPYEDEGRGAVYIYSGARILDPNQNGKQMLIQRIQPEPNDGIFSFGFSLTTLENSDAKGCNGIHAT